MWSSKMGLPVGIQDDDIDVEMPSSIGADGTEGGQFTNVDYFIAQIRLSKIVGNTISKIYSRRKQSEIFLQRVQKILRDLKNWVETLPEKIKLNSEDNISPNSRHILSLHLSFNQVRRYFQV
jgi:hypothetical protein